MKIGILTFWNTEDNYGQLLQCYALQTYLRSIGHDTFLLRSNVGLSVKPSVKMQMRDKLRTAYLLREFPLYLIKRICGSAFFTLTHFRLRENRVDRGFEKFRQDYLNCTKVFSVDELRTNPPEADAYIAGSDQIWNTKDGFYYLTWANDKVRKLSYAASFGACDGIPDNKTLTTWLNRFDHISVREQSGVEICKSLGLNSVECVVDPTLLLASEDYLRIADEEYPKEKYLFIYFLGTRTNINWKEILAYARKKCLKIVYVCNNTQQDKFKHENVTITRWLSLIAHAECVITNSFHGTVFALTFGKRFINLPIIGFAAKMNDRITTLLTPLGLTNHIYKDSINIIDEEINYMDVFNIMQKNAIKSQYLLKQWTC